MRLISCKIENFGMLSNVEYTFDAPIHIISAENGAGKSTLAAFLKAMLYGLENKGRSIEDNERKRYMPWQGGRFGGSLFFVAGGHTYRVERFFGKTPKGDTFALYDAETNLVSNAFSSALGEELFGIDGEAFARTTFFTWQPVEKGEYNNSIHAKLNGLLDATDDIGDFDAAIERLDAERKVYEKRGNTGRLAELEEALHDLSLALQKTVEAKALLSEKTAEYEACAKGKEEKEAALEKLRRELKEQQRKEAQRGVAMQLLRYEKELASCDAAMSAATQTLGGAVDIPAETFASALAEARASYQRYTLALAKAEDHEKEITAAKASFAQTASLPDDATFVKIAEAVTEYTALSAKGDMTADATKAELQEAKQLLMEAEAAHQAVRSAEDALRRAERSLPTKQSEGNSKAKTMALTVIGACLLLASVLGIVLLRTAPFPAIFLCVAIASFVLLALGIYSFIKVGRDAALAEAAYREYEIARVEAEEKRRACEAYAVRLRAAVVDLTSEETFQAAPSIEVLLTWARAEIAKAEVASLQAESKGKRLAAAKEAAEAALDVYAQAKGDTPMARLSALRESVAQYKEERKRLTELLQRESVNTAQAEAARAQVESFLAQFGDMGAETLSASLQAVESARRDYDAACARKSAILLERTQYLADEGITEKDVPLLLTAATVKPSEEMASDDMEVELRKEIDAYKTRLYQIGAEIESLDQVVGEVSYLEAQEASLQKELAEAEHTRDLIALTKGFLENAKIELSTRYLRTMEAHFLRYFRLVAPMREEEIAIDANLSPKVEIGGTRQPVEAFSHGLRDLLNLCMRLALTESMYEESTEYPPLILDDPFVNLDEAKLEKAKLLLDTLAKRYQILYFTCHESRELK